MKRQLMQTNSFRRIDGRKPDELRPVEIHIKYVDSAPGSALIVSGKTKVLCTVSIEEAVPPFLEGTGKGWLTAEYSMIPASTPKRKPRERLFKVDGRTFEIQRVIGRALRCAIDLDSIGENTIWVDCDVLEADGGTRTTAITGAFVALVDAVHYLLKENLITKNPIINSVAAVSVGIINNTPTLDLCYLEDSQAQVDMNLVMTRDGRFVEIQGTSESKTFSSDDLNSLLKLGQIGISQLIEIQNNAIAKILNS